MRAREFTINVPITIKINGDGDPEIDMPSSDEPDENPIYVSPLQQELELKKAEAGKDSDVIQDITQDQFNNSENSLSADELNRVRELLSKLI